MARGINKRNLAIARRYAVGADVLGNAAGLPRGDPGVTNVIQKRGFTMVHMAHHRNDWGSRRGIAFNNQRGFQFFFQRIFANEFNPVPHLFHD